MIDLKNLSLVGDFLEERSLSLGHVMSLHLSGESLEGPAFLGLRLLLLLTRTWVGTDGGVGLLVNTLEPFSANSFLDESRELTFEGSFIFVQEVPHVGGDVLAKDVFAVDIGLQLLRFIVPPWESLLGVRNVKATINGSLEGSEDSGSGGGAVESNVKDGLEGLWLSIGTFNAVVFTINILLTFVYRVKSKLFQ